MSIVFVSELAKNLVVSNDLRNLKASLTVLMGYQRKNLTEEEKCTWEKLMEIQERLEQPSVFTGQNNASGKPVMKEAQFICRRGQRHLEPLLCCGRKPLAHRIDIVGAHPTPNGGHVQIVQYWFIAPVLDSQNLNIGVVQGNRTSGSTTAVAEAWEELAAQLCRMQVRVLVGDIKKKRPFAHGLK